MSTTCEQICTQENVNCEPLGDSPSIEEQKASNDLERDSKTIERSGEGEVSDIGLDEFLIDRC